MATRFTLPRSLDLHATLRFLSAIRQAREDDEYIFDFGKAKYFPPFSMLLLATEIRRFREARPNAAFRAARFVTHRYPGHMGFFKLFGLPFGREPGEAEGNAYYLPITEVTVSSITEQARRDFAPAGEVVEGLSVDLAAMLTRETSGDLLDTLRYTLREMFRNVVEHSRSESFVYSAQYWPARNLVEVGIIDTGVGLRASLSHNPKLKIANDHEAVCVSVLPGVSGKGGQRSRRDKGPWANSGYGLYMTMRICAEGGNFFVCSGKSGLKLGSETREDFETDYQGTAIRLIIDVRRVARISEALEKFAREGHVLAKETRGAFKDSASVASRMLSREFTRRPAG